MRISVYFILLSLMLFSCQSLNRGKVKQQNLTESKITNAKNNSVSKRTQEPYLKSAQNDLYKELTGKKNSQAQIKNQKLNRVLVLAREAAAQNDIKLALKRYNVITEKFPNTNESVQAHLDKARIYKTMGLLDASQFNEEKARLLQKRLNSKNQIAPVLKK